MAAKEVKFRDAARAKIVAGVNVLADAVKLPRTQRVRIG